LFAGLSSSSESLLLDEAAFLTGCCVGFATGADLTGTTDAFFFVSSSDESESDDESFFLLLERLADGGTGAFLTTGVTLAASKKLNLEETKLHQTTTFHWR
jgi:hypothetical protein